MSDKEIDFDSKKFLFLLIIICIIFFIAVMKAFDYLPKNDGYVIDENYSNIQQQIKEEPSDAEESDSQEENGEDSEDEQDEEDEDTNSEKNAEQESDIDEIDAPPGVNPIKMNKPKAGNELSNNSEPVDSSVKRIQNAENLVNEGKFNEAIEEYKGIIESTQDKNLIAKCYDNLSIIYAGNKRYGSALSYAIKAYNEAPSDQRALAIAKLYNKTGNTEQANKIMNKLLQE